MIVRLLTEREVALGRRLIEESGLSFENEYDELVGSFDGERLVAVAARAGMVLKMFAVARAHQAGALLDELATELVKSGFAAGLDTFFVFTKPEYATTFQGLNFTLLASHERAALLEYGSGIRRYLERHGKLVRGGSNGCVVVNCNPFTLGHRHLVETAARAVDHLYVLVVREDVSVFPFEVRFRLVREGVADLANVHVLDTSHYAVSRVTFPSYFLPSQREADTAGMEIDLQLFARKIAPFFRIGRRFVGTEPCCSTTYSYNETMKGVLPREGIEVVEVPRKETAAGVVSASTVRRALAAGDRPLLETLVPETTLRFLLSEEAEPIRRQLAIHTGRH